VTAYDGGDWNTDPGLVERVAQAIRMDLASTDWEVGSERVRDGWRRAARAAIGAMPTVPAQPAVDPYRDFLADPDLMGSPEGDKKGLAELKAAAQAVIDSRGEAQGQVDAYDDEPDPAPALRAAAALRRSQMPAQPPTPSTGQQGGGDGEDEFYTRPDGIVDTLWMKPHRDLVDSLPVSDEQRAQINAAFDAIHARTIEERIAEHQSEHGLLMAIMRSAAPPTRTDTPNNPPEHHTDTLRADLDAALAEVKRLVNCIETLCNEAPPCPIVPGCEDHPKIPIGKLRAVLWPVSPPGGSGV
jgi:hypothetical protein